MLTRALLHKIMEEENKEYEKIMEQVNEDPQEALLCDSCQ